MKKLLSILMGQMFLVSLFIFPATLVKAEQFIVTATLPAATGVTITATRVRTSDNVFQNTVTELNFDPLRFDPTNGIWVPDHYFAIDVGGTGGAGSPNVTVSYGNETSPAGQVKGLGFKSSATFVKITGPSNSQTQTPLAAHGPIKLLKDLRGGEVVNGSELVGGFLRLYVGIYTGGNSTLDAAGGEPFTNADRPGTYQGTLTVTAVVA
jgi:hypothetical protein